MTKEEREILKQAAEKAKRLHEAHLAHVPEVKYYHRANAFFELREVATPDAILSLIEQIERLESANEAAVKWIKKLREPNGQEN
jgi:uncharacterized protein YkuJ